MFPVAGRGERGAGATPGDKGPSGHRGRWVKTLALGRITSSYSSDWGGEGRKVVPALWVGCHPRLSDDEPHLQWCLQSWVAGL